MGKIKYILFGKTKIFCKKIRKKIFEISFKQKQVEWLIETFRDIGVTIFAGSVISGLICELELQFIFGLLIIAFLSWYTSLKLIKNHD